MHEALHTIGRRILGRNEQFPKPPVDPRTEVSTANILELLKLMTRKGFNGTAQQNGIQIEISPYEQYFGKGQPTAKAVQLTVTYPSLIGHLDETKITYVDHPTLNATVSITTSDKNPETNEYLSDPVEDAIHRIPDGLSAIDVDYFNYKPTDPQEAKRVARLNDRLAIAYNLAFTLVHEHRLPARVPRPARQTTRQVMQPAFAR